MIRKRKLIISIIALAFAVSAVFFFGLRKEKGETNSEGLSHFSVKTFQTDSGWAYRIYQDSTPVIEQLSPPGLPGKLGFASQELALKTASLVKKKLDQGIFPPTITPAELDSMGIR